MELIFCCIAIIVIIYYIYVIMVDFILPIYVYILYIFKSREEVREAIGLFEKYSFGNISFVKLFIERFYYYIFRAKNTDEANNIRKWYNQELGFSISVEILYYFLILNFGSIFVIYFVWKKYKGFKANFLTLKEVNLEAPFVLYLRSFDNDYYYEDKGFYSIIKNDILRYDYFNEKLLAKKLKGIVNFYGIGMTRELASPNGAARIYIDDDCWCENVLQMIKKCTAIVILINKKNNCIWEFEQAFPYKEKVFCVSYDNNVYNDVKNILRKNMENMTNNLIYLPPEKEKDHFWFRLSDSVVHSLENKDDYKTFSDEIKAIKQY